jgi:hypothetical protein
MRRDLPNAARAVARLCLMAAALASWFVQGPAQAGHAMAAEPDSVLEAAIAPAPESPVLPGHPGLAAANHVCASCAPALAGAAPAGTADAPIPPAVVRLPRWSYRAAALQGSDVAPLYRPP